MIKHFNIKTTEDVDISNKHVLIRVDYNVPLTPKGEIADDMRITKTLNTLNYLLKRNNKLILLSHLGRPNGRDPKFSIKPVAKRLQKMYPKYKVIIINDFEHQIKKVKAQKENEIMILENIRFYRREKTKNIPFSKKLAELADVYVNEAFAMSHRVQTSVVGVPQYIPSYAGLLFEEEIRMLSKATHNAKNPVVSIIGGAKISTKINLIDKLIQISDYILIGGGLANTFLCAQGHPIGDSLCEYEEIEKARQLLFAGGKRGIIQILPIDVVTGHPEDESVKPEVFDVHDVPDNRSILDIGPQTQKAFADAISKAGTIIWNGPMGLFEKDAYRKGSDAIYDAIVNNKHAVSILGGGDTLAILSGKKNTDIITHISTGGGAMLEFIEKGTLPGIVALQHSQA